MKNKKFVFVCVVLACVIALLFYFAGLRREFRTALDERRNGEGTVRTLEGQVNDLRQAAEKVKLQEQSLYEQMRRQREQMLLLEEDVRKSRADASALAQKAAQEKESGYQQNVKLQQQLQRISGDNERLTKDMEALREKLALFKPVLRKLTEIEAALSQIEVKKGREVIAAIELDSLLKEIAGLNLRMSELVGGSREPGSEAALPASSFPEKQEAAQSLSESRSRQDLENLSEQLSEVTRERDSLRRQYAQAQEMLVRQQKELNSRAEKLFTMQEKLMRTENSLFEAQVNYKEMEKNASIAREKYVAGELEKSGLKIALDQTRQELAQLQNKFLALLAKIGGIFKAQDSLRDPLDLEPEKKGPESKIEVELIPQHKGGT